TNLPTTVNYPLQVLLYLAHLSKIEVGYFELSVLDTFLTDYIMNLQDLPLLKYIHRHFKNQPSDALKFLETCKEVCCEIDPSQRSPFIDFTVYGDEDSNIDGIELLMFLLALFESQIKGRWLGGKYVRQFNFNADYL